MENNRLWKVWESELPSDFVDKVNAHCQKLPAMNARLGFDATDEDQQWGGRSSTVRWVDKLNPEYKYIADMIWYHVEQANRMQFGFDICSIQGIQHTTYDSSNRGEYKFHIDTFWGSPMAYDRKLSIVIQLSDENSYEGGDFMLDPQVSPPIPNVRKKGTIFVFPSFLLHCVTPVTRGVRNSLVSWIEGPKFR